MMAEVTRYTDWANRLRSYLGSVAQRRGEVGVHDCVMFSAGAVHAMTGWSPDPSLLNYSSEPEGQKLLEQLGFEDVAAFLDAQFDPVCRSFLRPGDIALLQLNGQQVIGVVQGELVYVAALRGLGLEDFATVDRGWRVG